MKKKLVFLMLIGWMGHMGYAQNCSQFNLPVAPGDNCQTAAPFCASYLNGYCSNNGGFTADDPGGLSNTLGCSIENNQWLTFVPCENTASFTFTVGSCNFGNGLEFSILQTGDCSSFFPLAACQTTFVGGTITVFASPLTVGETYFLMVDGVGGDACDWQITGLQGVSDGGASQENFSPGHIEGDTLICLDNSNTPSPPTPYTAIGPVCSIDIADPNNNTCPPGTDDICPPAIQQFTQPFLDTMYNVVTWDTVWKIIPANGGHFFNNDNIGSNVLVIWDTTGYFLLDADLVPAEVDTIIFINSGIGSCGAICPDNDVCDILPIGVHVGTSTREMIYTTLCPPYCMEIYGIQICGPGHHLLVGDFILDPPTNCIDTVDVFIDAAPPIFVNIVEQPPVCSDSPMILTADVSGSLPELIFWSNGANTPSITVNPGSGNFFWVDVYNDYNCYDHDSEFVNWPAPIPVTTLPPLQLCQGQIPYNFQGQNINSSGTYQVTLQSWQGCDSSITQSITVFPPVNVGITSSVGNNLTPGETAILNAGSGFANYLWNDNSTGQTLSTDLPGTYTITVTASSGCSATASITLTQASADCPQFNLPIAPADSCTTAPPFCASYLNGYCSSNLGSTADIPGNLGSISPCTIENNQWLKFTACDSSVQLVLSVSNCLAATGLEFFVLQTADCQIFEAQAACFEVADGATDTLTVGGLTPGETYYLMVDGIGGDACAWQVLSTVGISEGAVYEEENTPGQVESVGDVASFCAGGTGSFYFTPADCGLNFVSGCPAYQQLCTPNLDTCTAVQYDTVWHVTPAGAYFANGDSIGATVDIIFPDTLPVPQDSFLEFTVSVEFVAVAVDTFTCWNDCLAECRTILPGSAPCAILPKVVKVCKPDSYTQFFTVCPGECVDFMGQTFCSPGAFTVTEQDVCGCTDSYTVVVDWFVDAPPSISPATYTCSPDGTTYTVSFDVFAVGNFVTVDGQPLFGPTFTSGPIPSGQPYNFLVVAFGFCGTSFPVPVGGSHTCPPCIGGTHDLGTISLCPGECFSLLGNTYCNLGSYSQLLFDPALNCSETYNFTLTQIVENPLAVGITVEFCDASNLYYSVGFPILSGNAPYFVNGNPVSGSFYQSGPIPSGQPYAFTVTDAATCNPQQINIGGIFTCPCVNSPGTVELAVINQCEGEMADVGFNNDAVVGPADLLVFILHTDSGSSLGTVIDTNTTGSFGYVPGLMSFGQTYYISPAVGPDAGGMVDMNSACFSLAPGQPVVFYSAPAVQILQPDTLTCSLNTLMLNSLPSGGSGDFSFDWSGPNNFTSAVANPIISEPGAYLLTLTDNLTACQGQSATTVASDTALPVFTVTSGEINCQQPDATLEAASQMPGVTYTWTFPTGDMVTGAVITTNIPGDYAVTALGPNGCTAGAVTFVTDNGVPPSIAATGDTINCSQPTAELTATSNDPAATFVWTLPDTTTSTGSTLTTSLVGTYSVVATSPNGCTAEATTVVAEGPDPELKTDVEVTDPTCHGYSDGSIKVLGTTGGTAPYEYTLNDTLTGDFFQDLPAGDYLLSTTDANGCMGEDTIQLVDPPEVTVQIGDDQFVNLGQSVTLTMQASITPDSIVWYGPNGQVWPGVNSLTISPTESGRFTIVISDVNSCRSSDTTDVYVNGQGKVFVPNVFSPNGDGNNDVLLIFAGGDVEQILEFQIFDRWGEMVFQHENFRPNDPVYGWDGRHKGKPMDPAVFVVKAMVEFKDGTQKMVTGDVVLMR